MIKEGSKKLLIDFDSVIDVLFVMMIVINSTLELDLSWYIIPKIFIAIFFLAITVYIIKTKNLVFGFGMIFPVLFFLFETLSVFWSEKIQNSIVQWNTQSQLLLLFLFIYYYIATRNSLKTFLLATYLSGYSLLVYTLIKYGINGILLTLASSERLGREINNENVYGMFFSFAVLVAFYWITKGKSKFHIISIVLFTFFALASGSKKAIIMIVAGIVAISLLTYGIKKIWKTLVIIALLYIAVLVVINSGLFGSLIKRMDSFLSGELNLSDQRREMYRAVGLEMIYKKPIFGHGIATFAKLSGFNVHAHDNVIEIGVGTGIIGIILYYIPWLFSAVKLCKHSFNRKNEWLLLFVFVVLYIIMGVAMVQYSVRSSWILLAVSLAMIDRVESNENDLICGKV